MLPGTHLIDISPVCDYLASFTTFMETPPIDPECFISWPPEPDDRKRSKTVNDSSEGTPDKSYVLTRWNSNVILEPKIIEKIKFNYKQNERLRSQYIS